MGRLFFALDTSQKGTLGLIGGQATSAQHLGSSKSV